MVARARIREIGCSPLQSHKVRGPHHVSLTHADLAYRHPAKVCLLVGRSNHAFCVRAHESWISRARASGAQWYYSRRAKIVRIGYPWCSAGQAGVMLRCEELRGMIPGRKRGVVVTRGRAAVLQCSGWTPRSHFPCANSPLQPMR